jgi:hypothetical protein
VVIGLAALVFFTWADWHVFAQDQQAHHESAAFWSVDFLAHWGDNAAQNWHSELLFGGRGPAAAARREDGLRGEGRVRGHMIAAGMWGRLPEWAHDVLYGLAAFAGVSLGWLLWAWDARDLACRSTSTR